MMGRAGIEGVVLLTIPKNGANLGANSASEAILRAFSVWAMCSAEGMWSVVG